MDVLVTRALNIFIGEVHRFIAAAVALDAPNVTFLCCRPIQTAYALEQCKLRAYGCKTGNSRSDWLNEIFLVEMKISS